MEEGSLIAEFLRSRTESAFLALYHSQGERLYAMALRLCGRDREAADDLFQETWVVVIRSLDKYEGRSGFGTWLTGILINLSREKNRNEKRKAEFLNQDHPFIPAITTPIEPLDLEKALATLPRGYREVLCLHDIEGYTHLEIAEITGTTEGNSKSQLFQARRAMRKALTDQTNKENGY